jgi:hypothetical protein
MSELFLDLMGSPLAVRDHTMDQVFQLSTSQIRQLQDHWVTTRFAELRPRVAFLDRLAKEHGIDTVDGVDDAAPLLPAHTIYKSYPISYLENCQFDRMTRWLSALTATDLSGVNAAGIESIDNWIDELDAKTDLLVMHSSGTTGKLSFLPRTKDKARDVRSIWSNIWRDFNGAHTGPDMIKYNRPMIVPTYRYGAANSQRTTNINVELYAGGEDNVVFLYPHHRLSADVVTLSGRIRAAEAKGTVGDLQIPPELLRKREEYLELERQRPLAMAALIEEARNRFAGQDVYIGAIYGQLYDWAVEGLKKGQNSIFGPGSFAACGGGAKGRILPPDFKDQIKQFLGFDSFFETYSMTEISFGSRLCEEGKYHFTPMLVPYLLDPKTGAQLPRKDGTTGRMACFDLMPDTYWAGFVTGDEVTGGGWEKPCICGRTGFYVEQAIRRYSEQTGGNDKVVSNGAPEAHENAIRFLEEYAG